MTLNLNEVKKHIAAALLEDIGTGDVSTLCCIDSAATNRAKLIAKEEGVLCGVEIAKMVFETVDADIDFEAFKTDGERLQKGDVIFLVSGKARSILEAERTALNYIQRLSGIATQTAEYVQLIADTGVRILDTRKTTPTMRMMEKYAVKTGGGCNHRIGLYDMIMLKDNHIDFAGGITNAINKARNLTSVTTTWKVEIEVRDLTELKTVLETGNVDRIMLDNFDVETISEAVKMIDGRYEIEVSGGINKSNIRDYALSGVDYISVGALTHNIKALDLSLIQA
ncbi:MAG: carboxylating nicotinate-nucleotide diphosphorylase [Bacteroidales bacterium]|jgi:nicotinate-nucleotide pyrophosphorylase (carboxylating)|nr:carboxylating nicotinate-nucleotide diphosphorylase [Bacteroidales bacterium]